MYGDEEARIRGDHQPSLSDVSVVLPAIVSKVKQCRVGGQSSTSLLRTHFSLDAIAKRICYWDVKVTDVAVQIHLSLASIAVDLVSALTEVLEEQYLAEGKTCPIVMIIYSSFGADDCCEDVLTTRKSTANVLVKIGHSCGFQRHVFLLSGGHFSRLTLPPMLVLRATEYNRSLHHFIDQLSARIVVYLENISEMSDVTDRKFMSAQEVCDNTDVIRGNNVDLVCGGSQTLFSIAATWLRLDGLAASISLIDLPTGVTAESVETFCRRFLQRRNFLQTAMAEAAVLGVVVQANYIASEHWALIDRLRALLAAFGKRTLCVATTGNLSPENLTSFPEVDVFVAINCPLKSIRLTSHEERHRFHKPLCTPFDLLYCLQFLDDSISERGELAIPLQPYIADCLQLGDDYFGVFGHRLHSRTGEQDIATSNELVFVDYSKEKALTLPMDENVRQLFTSDHMLSVRSWKGLHLDLERKGEEVEAAKLEAGQSGLPAHYEEEEELF